MQRPTELRSSRVVDSSRAGLASEFGMWGKVVLVTGAARGIGRGIAEVLAEAGADIALNALTMKALEPTAKDIASATGRRVLPIVSDVTASSGAQAVVDKTLEVFGRIDVLVNGVGGALGTETLVPLAKGQDGMSGTTLRSVVDLNLTQALVSTQAVGAHMLERGSGKIINISSCVAGRPSGDHVVYTTAKTALMGFTRALAIQWSPLGVQVNCIAPGAHPDLEDADEAHVQTVTAIAERQSPIRRVGTVREVGLLALYLASSASDYMTGQTLFLDGGMSLGWSSPGTFTLGTEDQ